MKISIRDMLHAYAAANGKSWAHDRGSTIGASEIGQCLRKTWFGKQETSVDSGYVDRFGAKLRGDLIENHYWVPGIRSQLPEGVRLLYAGSDQRTLVDGYLSATSDGLLVDVGLGCLAHHGIVSIESDCLVIECKSIDPRVDLKKAKEEHEFQTQVQMGLIRHCTRYKPEYALISYTNASFLDDVTEFVIRFDPAVYSAARDRALTIMRASDAIQLPPEGKISGGKECEYCGYRARCIGATVAGIPAREDELGDNAKAVLKQLVIEEQEQKAEKESAAKEHGQAQEKIKEFLREHHTRKVEGEGFSVSYFPVRGRRNIDRKAAESAGVDLTSFETEGEPSERLTIRLS